MILNNTITVTVATHDGIFHADEIFAIALLKRALPKQEIIIHRTRTVSEIAKCDFAIDVGGEHAPSDGRFDHHQDPSLPSAFGLVYAAIGVGLDEHSDSFFAQFVRGIDIMDTAPNSGPAMTPEFRTLQDVISGFNRPGQEQDAAFETALRFAEQILENEILAAKQKGIAEREYVERQILKNGVAVFEKYSPIWKEKGEHLFAVMPYTTTGVWQIVARDTSLAAIPSTENVDGIIFRHNSGFMATFSDFESAIKFAKKL